MDAECFFYTLQTQLTLIGKLHIFCKICNHNKISNPNVDSNINERKKYILSLIQKVPKEGYDQSTLIFYQEKVYIILDYFISLGWLEGLEFIIKLCASLEPLKSNCTSFISIASSLNCLYMLNYIIKQGAVVNIDMIYTNIDIINLATFRLLLDHCENFHENIIKTPKILYKCLFLDKLDFIKELVIRNVDITFEDEEGDNLFRYGIAHISIETAVFLMEHNVNPCHGCSLDSCVVRLALEIRDKSFFTEFVAYFNRYETPFKSLCNAVSNVYKTDDICPVCILIANGADVNEKTMDGYTPLYVAVKWGLLDVVRLLLNYGAKTDCRDNEGKSLLHIDIHEDMTTMYSRVKMYKFLLTLPIDIETKTTEGYTPLHQMIKYGYTDLVRILIERGADIEARTKDRKTPLFVACICGRTDVCKVLIAAGANVNTFNYKGDTMLMMVSSLYFPTYLYTLLLSYGANINACNYYNDTALHFACNGNHIHAVENLLRYGANTNQINKSGNTPFELALMYSPVSVIYLFYSYGITLDREQLQRAYEIIPTTRTENDRNSIKDILSCIPIKTEHNDYTEIDSQISGKCVHWNRLPFELLNVIFEYITDANLLTVILPSTCPLWRSVIFQMRTYRLSFLPKIHTNILSDIMVNRVRYIGQSAQLKSLRILYLPLLYSITRHIDEVVSVITLCPNLEKLSGTVEHMAILDNCLDHIIGRLVYASNNLTTLDFKITPAFSVLDDYTSHPSLPVNTLCPTTTNQDSIITNLSITSLYKLDLSRTEVIDMLTHCPLLRKLVFKNSNISFIKEEWFSIIKTQCPLLTEIDLKYNLHISSSTYLKKFCSSFGHIKRLDLSYCYKLNVNILTYIFQNMPCLEYINLESCLNIESEQFYIAVCNMPSTLKVINIKNTKLHKSDISNMVKNADITLIT